MELEYITTCSGVTLERPPVWSSIGDISEFLSRAFRFWRILSDFPPLFLVVFLLHYIVLLRPLFLFPVTGVFVYSPRGYVFLHLVTSISLAMDELMRENQSIIQPIDACLDTHNMLHTCTRSAWCVVTLGLHLLRGELEHSPHPRHARGSVADGASGNALSHTRPGAGRSGRYGYSNLFVVQSRALGMCTLLQCETVQTLRHCLGHTNRFNRCQAPLCLCTRLDVGMARILYSQ